MTPTTTPAQPAQGYEHARAIMEGERNASLESHAQGLPSQMTYSERRVYEAGFTNGWDRHAAQAAALTAAPVAQAEWRLVPVEPTPEMLRAGDKKTWVLPALDCWRDMLAAAPAQPASEGAAYAALPDERAAFEAWIKKDCGDLSTFGSGQNIHYSNSAVNNAWTGWKAHASRAQAPATQQAGEDVDLPDAEDMAHSAVQEALSFGLSHDVIHRWMRHIQDQTVKAMRASRAQAPAGAAVHPQIQATLAKLDVPVRGYLASHSGTLHQSADKVDGTESAVPLVSQHDHSNACETIIQLLSTRTES